MSQGSFLPVHPPSTEAALSSSKIEAPARKEKNRKEMEYLHLEKRKKTVEEEKGRKDPFLLRIFIYLTIPTIKVYVIYACIPNRIQ